MPLQNDSDSEPSSQENDSLIDSPLFDQPPMSSQQLLEQYLKHAMAANPSTAPLTAALVSSINSATS